MNPYRDVEDAEHSEYVLPPFGTCVKCSAPYIVRPGARLGDALCGLCAPRTAAPVPVVIERGQSLSIMPYRAHDIDAAQEPRVSVAEVVGRIGLTGAVVLVAVPAAVVMLSAVAVGFLAWLLVPHRDREVLAS